MVVAQLRRAEHEEARRVPVEAVHAGHPARRVVHDAPVRPAQPRVHRDQRHVEAEVAHPARAERQAADHRVQTVRADDQVEPAGRAGRERHVHAAGVLGKRGDRVAENVFRVVARRLVQRRQQVGALHLEVVGPCSANVPRSHRRHPPARAVDVLDALGVRARRPERRQHAHPLRHLESRAPDVDRGAARPDPRRLLHHRHLVAGPGQPVGRHRTRDTRPGNEYTHDSSPFLTVGQ